MNYWLFFIPVISAFIGWVITRLAIKMLFHPRNPKKILGITFQGIFPKKQPEFAAKLGKLVNDEFSFGDIEQKITQPGNLNEVMPMIEKHVDDFLQTRLTKEMPFLSMFIGNKTIATLKKTFMEEIRVLLPEVISQFAGNLKKQLDPEQMITQKVAGFPPDKLEKLLNQHLSGELRLAKLFGALIGFIIGVIQLIITLLMA